MFNKSSPDGDSQGCAWWSNDASRISNFKSDEGRWAWRRTGVGVVSTGLREPSLEFQPGLFSGWPSFRFYFCGGSTVRDVGVAKLSLGGLGNEKGHGTRIRACRLSTNRVLWVICPTIKHSRTRKICEGWYLWIFSTISWAQRLPRNAVTPTNFRYTECQWNLTDYHGLSWLFNACIFYCSHFG